MKKLEDEKPRGQAHRSLDQYPFSRPELIEWDMLTVIEQIQVRESAEHRPAPAEPE